MSIETVRTYGRDDLAMLDSSALGSLGLDDLPEEDVTAAEGKLASVFVRARKVT